MSAPPDLPPELWLRVETFLADTAEDPETIAADLVAWADGGPPEDLEGLLDALRDRGAYPISLHVLAAAWEAEMPEDLLGRVAHDRVGTILHGLGDRAGAVQVARSMQARALELGPAFAGDLGDLWLSMGLTEAAGALVRAAAADHPGDLALRFNLGVVQKLAGEWAASRESFTAVLRHHADQAALWNLGIACTALADWPGARAAWSTLGFPMPPGDGDIATPGEMVALQIPGDGSPEVVWGRRLCPARAQLRTLPFRSGFANFGDILLIDGVPAGELAYPDGQRGPILPALAVLDRRGVQTAVAEGPFSARGQATMGRVAELLNTRGWPAADWTELVGSTHLCLALGLVPPATLADARAALAELSGGLTLTPPRLRAGDAS